MVNVQAAIQAVCRESHLPMVQKAFGDEGTNALFRLMRTIQDVYKHIELERVTGGIIVFEGVGSALKKRADENGLPADFASFANSSISWLYFEVLDDGSTFLRSAPTITLEDLSKDAVVYRYEKRADYFYAAGERKELLRLDNAAHSQFSIPTFHNVREALQHYSRDHILESSCYLFRNAWKTPKRIFFVPGPEWIMRDSLTQYLRNRIGHEYEVWPEQIVDDSHPVDIQVKPKLVNNRLMLIEIKWLGDSLGENGRITAKHRDSRAQTGMKQLADYLDAKRQQAPASVVHGYYVVIDGRRRGATPTTTEILRADGLHYENEDITYSPAYHSTRIDFDPPYRMFARPICSD